MFFGSFIENLLNYTIPMYKNNGAIQSMWDNLQNKWGSIFTINTNDECIEYFGIWFSFLLWRLECCGVNSYDDWRGLSSPEQQADCFLPLSCDNSYNYRREKLQKKTIYLQWKKSKLISVRVMVLLQTLVKVYSCVWRLPRKFLRR